jgi:hypothetical protein
LQILKDHVPNKKPIVFVVQFNPEGYSSVDGGKLLKEMTEAAAEEAMAVGTPKKKATKSRPSSTPSPRRSEEDTASPADALEPPVTVRLTAAPYGMTINGPDKANPGREGVYITQVKPGKVAAKAGVKVGMRLLKIGGKEVRGSLKADCSALIKQHHMKNHMTGTDGKALVLVLVWDPKGFGQYDGGEMWRLSQATTSSSGNEGDVPPPPPRPPKVSSTPSAPTAAESAQPEPLRSTLKLKIGGARLFEDLMGDTSPPIPGVSGTNHVDLESQLAVACAHVRWTTVKIVGLPNSDGYYQVLRERYLTEPIYRRKVEGAGIAPRFIWFSHGANSWVISPEVGQGPVLAAAPRGFVRPQLVSVPWKVIEVVQGFEEGCEPRCELAPISKCVGYRHMLTNNPEVTIHNTELTNMEVADLCAELQDPASRLVELKLWKTKLSTEALAAIATALTENQSLTHLQSKTFFRNRATPFGVCVSRDMVDLFLLRTLTSVLSHPHPQPHSQSEIATSVMKVQQKWPLY